MRTLNGLVHSLTTAGYPQLAERIACLAAQRVSFPGAIRNQAATIYDTVEHAFMKDDAAVEQLLTDIQQLYAAVKQHLQQG